MKIFLFLTMLYVISACALESNTTMTTIPEEVVPEEVIVIKETKACTDEGTCKWKYIIATVIVGIIIYGAWFLYQDDTTEEVGPAAVITQEE